MTEDYCVWLFRTTDYERQAYYTSCNDKNEWFIIPFGHIEEYVFCPRCSKKVMVKNENN